MTAPEPSTPLLDPEEMAVFLGISRSTLDRWSKTPGFPVLRSGRMVRFPWRKVVDFLEQASTEGRQLYSRADRPKGRRK